MDFEISKVTKGQTNVDGFTLLYTYFRFPTWWFIGVLEVVFLRSIEEIQIKIRAVSKKPPGKKTQMMKKNKFILYAKSVII
jgi:hypothetical protein